jgi:(1->4)-alpha-D-glucan 1-alpha-D-glucosylmutase
LLAQPDAQGRDLTARAVRDAVVELLVALPVYRAYDGEPGSPALLDEAAATAVSRRPDRADAIEWVRRNGMTTRFEQTTGPVMAKGVEDTALYRWHRLVALNEVGGDPAVFSRDVAHWHAWCEHLAAHHPSTMTTLSTHDTKRSEDVRARLAVLSEIPAEWSTALTRWRERADRHSPPDANTDYLMWQTLVGAWPIPVDRVSAYLEKATREAKLHTSWTEPDPAYDEALRQYIERVFADEILLDDVGSWVEEHLAAPGLSNSLAQKLLQMTMPGVADIYQGNELVDRSLVDPDNRRPVDYDERRRALAAFTDPKLVVTATAARLRRNRPGLVGAPYRRLDVTGDAAGHAVAFARGEDVVSIATRLPVGLARRGGWGDTRIELPRAGWHDLLTGRDVVSGSLDELLNTLPVALIAR